MRLPHLSPSLVKESHLTKRLQAWWAGYYFEDETKSEPEPEEATAQGLKAPEKPGREAAAWSDPRVQVGEEIWGRGYMSPGGDALVESLIRPLGLDSSMMVVDFGAGLGGATRVLHNQTGAWVSGFEASPLLAEAAMELSRLDGVSKKASVETFDPKNLALRESSFNAVFSKEALFVMENKEEIYKALYDCLRVDGQLLITDYLATKPEATSEAIEEWMTKEPIRPILWSLEQTRSFFTDLGFEVRITEDVTANARKQILAALAEFSGKMGSREETPRGWNPAILAEIEMWANRIKVLDSGDVAMYRIYGRKYDPSLK